MTQPKNYDTITELDQILVPTSTGRKAYNLLELLGFGKTTISATGGMGYAPLHFISQRGPYQDGETPLDMRWDTRTIQIVINERLANRTAFFDRRYELVDMLRANRSFDGTVTPLVYRKWLPGGMRYGSGDLETTAASNTVTSELGKFIHNGLRPGCRLVIIGGANAGTYLVTGITNDYTATVTPALAATATDQQFYYSRANSYRDLFCLLEAGPNFDESVEARGVPVGYTEALRFVAHDPFWYGDEQNDYFVLPGDVDDLIFDGEGAWFGEAPGVGRWLFATDYVGLQTDLIYWGHEAAYPTIIINGPANDTTVSNNTTGATITLDYNIALGESVTIDTVNLSVENNLGDNLFPYLTGDLASFALWPEPQAPDRKNTISVSFDDGLVGSSSVSISWRNKYVSL